MYPIDDNEIHLYLYMKQIVIWYIWQQQATGSSYNPSGRVYTFAYVNVQHVYPYWNSDQKCPVYRVKNASDIQIVHSTCMKHEITFYTFKVCQQASGGYVHVHQTEWVLKWC